MTDVGRRRALAQLGVALWTDPSSLRDLGRWIRTQRTGHSPIHDRLPWMSFKAIRWLSAYLRPSMDVFEYGAGGSTPFVASRVRKLVSVEHDPRWVAVVSDVLAAEGIRNCELRLIPAVKSERAADVPYGPGSYTSFAPHTKGYTFEAYVRSIDDYPDRSFDLVIVDGYARPSAVAQAIPKIRPGGYLLLDDSDREYTKPAIPVLDGFPRRDFLGLAPFERALQQASIWRIDAP